MEIYIQSGESMKDNKIIGRIYPILFYTLIMPLISGISVGTYNYIEMAFGLHSFKISVLLFMCGVFTMGAYVYGSIVALSSGVTVQFFIKQPKIYIVLFSSSIAMLIGWLVSEVFKTGLSDMVIPWGGVGTVLTSILYFRTKNYRHLSNGG